jgi:riboflavin kinase / FMN adenylyltransferase
VEGEAGIYRTWSDLGALRGKRVAMTIGIFDGIHRGHMQLFNLTRELAADASGIPLIFTFQNHPLQLIDDGRAVKFITLPSEKIVLLRKLGFNHIACFDFDERFAKLRAGEFFTRLRSYINLRALVAGYDASLGSDRVRSDESFEKLAREHGFEFLRVGSINDNEAPISSRRIRALLTEGNVSAANELLVYPYFVRGKVEQGRGIGKSVIHVPTANLLMPPEKLIPLEGVYAGSFHREHRHYPAALVIVPADRRPSFLPEGESGNPPHAIEPGTMLVEAHIIGQDISLYGRTVEFIFLQRLRDNFSFPSVDKLREQINLDIAETVRVFDKLSLKLRFLP